MGKFFIRLWSVFLLVVSGMVLLAPANARAQDWPATIKVGLAQNVSEQQFQVEGNYLLLELNGARPLAVLEEGKDYRVKVQDGELAFYQGERCLWQGSADLWLRRGGRPLLVQSASGQTATAFPGGERGLYVQAAGGLYRMADLNAVPVLITAAGQQPLAGEPGTSGHVQFSGEPLSGGYRGDMLFLGRDNGYLLVNQLPVEEYLYGVVPAEMPSSWPAEALKAQAVAARTYAIKQIMSGNAASRGFDVWPDERSQVYLGLRVENPATAAAVDGTRGQILTYKDQVIDALFHSSSGGYTENSEDMWQNPVAYLRGKPDPYDQNDRHYNWQVNFTADQLARQLNWSKYNLTTVTDVQVQERTAVGRRIKRLQITGLDQSGNTVPIEIANADRLRRVLALKSAPFDVQKQYDQQNNLVAVVFTGSGWGHALGMPQWGARGMAQQGYNYREILSYYFTDVQLASIFQD
ncbi:MAG: SpoIID/LytB domain-containing protein [Desulfurispora sp.]|uniref:SpoIID/LytB domain-containing protein n=1 Tax=Desulfurispora sp. TaxID=3014275 RepID=UPI00404A570A